LNVRGVATHIQIAILQEFSDDPTSPKSGDFGLRIDTPMFPLKIPAPFHQLSAVQSPHQSVNSPSKILN
jgi:hypothetical protein